MSTETIYQSLYVQSRGALRRDLARYLRTGRALRVPNRQGTHRKNRVLPDMVTAPGCAATTPPHDRTTPPVPRRGSTPGHPRTAATARSPRRPRAPVSRRRRGSARHARRPSSPGRCSASPTRHRRCPAGWPQTPPPATAHPAGPPRTGPHSAPWSPAAPARAGCARPADPRSAPYRPHRGRRTAPDQPAKAHPQNARTRRPAHQSEIPAACSAHRRPTSSTDARSSLALMAARIILDPESGDGHQAIHGVLDGVAVDVVSAGDWGGQPAGGAGDNCP